MKEENELDQLFQKGLKKTYPFDEHLWKQVETQLPSAKKLHPFWHFNLNSIPLFIIILACAFLQTDSIKPLYATNQQPKGPSKIQKTENIYSRMNSAPETLGTTSVLNKAIALKEANIQLDEVNQKITTKVHSSQQAQILVNNKNKALTELEENNEKLESLGQSEKSRAGGFSLAPLTKNEIINRSTAEKRQQSILLIEPLGYAFNMNSLTTIPVAPKVNEKLQQLQKQLKPNYIYFEVEAYRSLALDKKIKGNNQQFIEYKNNSETQLYREGLGVNIFRDVKGFSFGLGIHYNTFVERANYLYSDEQSTFESSYDTSYQLVNRNFSSNGNPVFLIEENIDETVIENKAIITRQLLVRNEFKRLQLPVIVGFKHHIGRWTAGIQSAVVFNYLTESNGFYVKENLDDFSKLNEETLFNSMVYSQKNQVNIGYTLNEFVLIGSRFSYEYDINSFTKNYDSKFRSYNLGLWLQWRP